MRYRKIPPAPTEVDQAVAAFAPEPNLPQVVSGQGSMLRQRIYELGLSVNLWARQRELNPRTVRGWLEERAPVPAWVWKELAPYPFCGHPKKCIPAGRCMSEIVCNN